MTIVCVSKQSQSMKAVPFPPRSPRGSRWRLVRPPPWLPHRYHGCRCVGRTPRSGRAVGDAGRAAVAASGGHPRPERLLHAQARRRRRPDRHAALSARSDGAAVDDESRAGRRSGREPAVGQRAHRAARALHAVLPDVVDDRPPAALDRYERELAVDARMLEGGLPRRTRRARRPRVLSVLVRAVSRVLGRVRSRLPVRAALRARRRHVQPAAAAR